MGQTEKELVAERKECYAKMSIASMAMLILVKWSNLQLRRISQLISYILEDGEINKDG